jgi:hypothetical protein
MLGRVKKDLEKIPKELTKERDGRTSSKDRFGQRIS